MKEGECKETYIKWKQCVEEGEKNDKDSVNKCFQVTSDLRKCMEAKQDHYCEFLQAEKSTGIKLVSFLKRMGAFEDAIRKAEKDIASFKLIMFLHAQRKADKQGWSYPWQRFFNRTH